MTLERFAALLAAYGARPELWPDAERDAALAFRDARPEARASFDAELGLDAVFASEPTPELDPSFLRRLNEVPLRAPQKRARWSLREWWLPAVGWAFAAAMGIGLGVTTEPSDDVETPAVAAVAGVDSGAAASPASVEEDFGALAQGTLVDFEE
jgi:hypothetical protein